MTKYFLEKMKRISQIVLFLLLSCAFVQGQNCSCISGTLKNNNLGGVTSSKDYYSLLIKKTQKEGVFEFPLILVAASKINLTDSMLQTTGHFDLQLLDGTKLLIDSVKYENNPLGFTRSLGFIAKINEEQAKLLAENPIVVLTVPEIQLTTEFSTQKQKLMQRILTCLLNRNK